MNLLKNFKHKTMFILVLIPVLFLGLSSTASAQGFVPLATIPGLTDMQPTAGGLATFFNNLYKYLIGLAAILAVIQIIRSGIEIAWNQDDVSKIKDDKGKIYNAIAGLVLVLSPALVFSIINPAILDLSIGLAPIDLSTRPTTPTANNLTANRAPGNSTYTDQASIPSGQWCFNQGSSYVCSSDETNCARMYTSLTSSATGSCRQYPITN